MHFVIPTDNLAPVKFRSELRIGTINRPWGFRCTVTIKIFIDPAIFVSSKIGLVCNQVITGPVKILQGRFESRAQVQILIIKIYAQTFTFRSFFGRNDNNAVGCFGTIQSGSRSSFQNRNTGNVFRVNIQKSVTTDSLVTPITGIVGFAVSYRNTINHNQRLVAEVNGIQPTHIDGHGTCRTTRSSLDTYTGSFTIQSRAEIIRTRFQQLIRLDGAYRIA